MRDHLRIVVRSVDLPDLDLSLSFEGGGAAFDPESGLLYVNSNEQPWIIRMVTHDTKSLYKNNCGGCHGDDLKGAPPTFPSLVDIGQRLSRQEIATIVRQGSGRMPGFASLGNPAITDIVDFLLTGKDSAGDDNGGVIIAWLLSKAVVVGNVKWDEIARERRCV